MVMAEVIGCRWRYHNNMFLSVYLKHMYIHCLIYQTTKPSAGTDHLVNSYYYNINHNVFFFLLLLLLVLLLLLLYSPNFFIILSISWHSLCSFASTYCTNRVRSDSVSGPHLLGPGAGCQTTSFIFFSPPSLCLLCLWEAAFLFCYRDVCNVTQRGSKLPTCAKPDGCGRAIALSALCGFVNQMLRLCRSWWKAIFNVLR